MHNFQKLFKEETDNSIIIRVSINKFRRCQISSEIFSSEMLYWHNTNSYILTKFITNADKVNYYSGQIQYFFKYTINLPKGDFEHNLTYEQRSIEKREIQILVKNFLISSLCQS